MANDILSRFNALHNQPANALGTTIASLVLRGGHRMISFPPAETRAAYFADVLPLLYNGLGITVNVLYTFPNTTGAPQLSIAFERQNTGFLYTGANFANSKVLTLTAPSVANGAVYAALAFADGTEIGSLAALEGYRLRVERVSTDGVSETVYVKQIFLTNTG
jgi:hypothetical protein